MSEVAIFVLIMYPLVAVIFTTGRWLEWNDSNILRLVLVGAVWPVVAFWFVFRASRATARYFRGRFWKELAEIAPTTVSQAPLNEGDDIAAPEYQAGQWKDSPK